MAYFPVSIQDVKFHVNQNVNQNRMNQYFFILNSEPKDLKQRVNKLLRIKRPEVFNLFADSDILQRYVQ